MWKNWLGLSAVPSPWFYEAEAFNRLQEKKPKFGNETEIYYKRLFLFTCTDETLKK